MLLSSNLIMLMHRPWPIHAMQGGLIGHFDYKYMYVFNIYNQGVLQFFMNWLSLHVISPVMSVLSFWCIVLACTAQPWQMSSWLAFCFLQSLTLSPWYCMICHLGPFSLCLWIFHGSMVHHLLAEPLLSTPLELQALAASLFLTALFCLSFNASQWSLSYSQMIGVMFIFTIRPLIGLIKSSVAGLCDTGHSGVDLIHHRERLTSVLVSKHSFIVCLRHFMHASTYPLLW